MYHATTPDAVRDIYQDNGFNRSQGKRKNGVNLFLGDGVYVTRDISKTLQYGQVCFKLLVYPGKTFIVDDTTPEEERTKWQNEYSSAWLPPNNTIHHTKQEETCVKSSSQVRILGIAYGYELLDFETQSMLRDCFGTGDSLGPDEIRILDAMLEDLGIIYSTFVHAGSQMLLSVRGRGGRGRPVLEEWSGSDSQLWSRTWDCCLENKATGEVLTFNEDTGVVLDPVNQLGDRGQKWRQDGQKRFLHKQSGKFLCAMTQSDGSLGVTMRGFHEGGDKQNWLFRCLDQTKTQDPFVNFTPWHNMTVWD